MSTTKLEKLLIHEVSGVDVPANLLDGWMVQKSAGLAFGPVAPWEVGEAESRVREFTKATDAPNDSYASCYLWKSGEGADYGDFKFLITDVVDGQLAVMPSALDAAEARLDSSSIPPEDKAEVAKTIAALRERMEQPTPTEKDATSIVERIKHLLLGKEIDVTKDELDAALDARFESFGKSLTEELAKSVAAAAPTGEAAPEATEAAPAATEPPAEVETTPSLTAEDLAKAIEEAQAPLLEILDKTLDRLESLERGGVARKSVAGQEDHASGEGETPAVPTVKDAIAKALGAGARA